MTAVHNYEQLMAWKADDVRRLIDKTVSAREPADTRAFWADPHRYNGEWSNLSSGIVVDTTYTTDSGGYTAHLHYFDGSSFYWISGQPIALTEHDEEN